MKIDRVVDKADRRRVPRIDTELYLQAREVPFSEHNQFNGCICTNISGSGACVSTFSFYPVDKNIYVEAYDGDTDYAFKVIGRVVWVEEVPSQRKFRMGIEWSDFCNEQYEHLKNLVINRSDVSGGAKNGGNN